MNNKLDIFHSPSNRTDNKKRVSRKKDDEHKYPIQATGNQIVYSLKECKNQYNKKILMSESGYLNPFYDDGINGVGGHCFGLLVNNKEESDYLIKLINSNLYKFYIEINKWSGFHHIKVLKTLPYIQLDENFTDNDLYKIFNLSEDEIELINNNYNKDDNICASSNKEIILCGAPLKKNGEICTNKANPQCNGRCKKHFVIDNNNNDNNNDDNISLSSNFTKSSTKSSNKEIILCGAPLKKKDETCKNKANPECNGRCKKHFVIDI
jgi:hypothetical protein